jgi:hypothetical protein
MPKFYFHVRDNSGVALDDEGAEFTDIQAARAEARASARDLVSERLKSRSANNGQTVEIADESGAILESLVVESILN